MTSKSPSRRAGKAARSASSDDPVRAALGRDGNANPPPIRDAILQAAADAGGGSLVAYLRQQADEHPAAFMTLLGKVLTLKEVVEDHGTFKLDFTVRFVDEAGKTADGGADQTKRRWPEPAPPCSNGT